MAVTVLRGLEPSLIAYFSAPERLSGSVLYFAPLPGPPRSLGAARLLLAQLRQRLGTERVEEILSRHAPAAALLLPGRRACLTPEEREGVRALAARLTSHMSHNFVLQHPLFGAWAALFVDLLTAGPSGPFTLAVPSQALLNWEDGALLKAVYRRFPDRAPDLVLGFDPGFRHEEDADGIVWSMSTYRSLALAMDFHGLQDGEPLDLPEATGSEATWESVLGRLRDLEQDPDDLEAQVRAALVNSPPPQPSPASRERELSPDLVSQAVETLRACFESFAFTSALRIGLDLLEKQPSLAPLDEADVHAILALSTHNRQFLAQSPELVTFLDRHLAAALARETRPAHRCALLYRLAVVHGRRKKDQDTAIGWARQAVEASRHPDLPRLDAAYQEAWSHNILAYVLMRLGRLDDAETETVAGFERLDDLVRILPELVASGEAAPPWELDLRASHSLLAFNTRTLLELLHRDDAEISDWLQRSRAVLHPIPAVARFDAFHWSELYGRMHRPDLALPIVLRGLEDTQREVDTMRGYELSIQAAELCDRLGDTVRARDLYGQIQAFRRRCGLPTLPAIEVSWAQACHREGLLDEARTRFTATLDHPAHGSPEARAELLAALARVEAEAGDEATADRLLDEAIDLAIESGDRDTLLRVALAAGRCHQVLGRQDEAREDYEQALEITASTTPDAPPVRSSDLLGALLGAWETGLGVSSDLAPRALHTASTALDEPEAWWELPRFLTLWSAHQDDLPDPVEDLDLREPWKRILTAAGQRRDCEGPLGSLRGPVLLQQG